MIDQNAELGVEVSGHHFFGALDGGDDGLFCALLVLGIMRRTGRSLGELLERFPAPTVTPDVRIPFTDDPGDTIDRIAKTCGGILLRLDGVRAQYDDGWALVRGSITEPVITLRFEGRDTDSLHAVAERFLQGAPELKEIVMERL